MTWTRRRCGEVVLVKAASMLIVAIFSISAAQHGDHRGTNFLFAFLENRVLIDDPVPRVYVISASNLTASVTIRTPLWNRPDAILTLPPHSTIEYSFESVLHMTTEGRNYKAIQVTSDEPIVLEAATINDLSSDAFLVLPVTSLNNDYLVLSYVYPYSSAFLQGPSSFGVVANQDGTMVTLYFPEGGLIDGNTIRSLDITNNTLSLTLQEAEAFLVKAIFGRDLTGVRVQSSAPVAVISGTTWTSVGREYMGDHLVEMVPPLSTWGTTFYTAPIAHRTSGDIFRILGHAHGTQVLIHREEGSPPDKYSLDAQQYVDVDASSSHRLKITASRRVLVGQLCKSHSADANRNTDPFLVIVPPSSQYTTSYIFTTINTRYEQETFNHFVNIIASTAALASLTLNGEEISPAQLLDGGWIPIPASSMSAGTLSLADGMYTLSTTDQTSPFTAMLYGLKFQESYGLSLGQQLRSLTYREICVALDMSQEDYFDNDCDGLFDEETANGLDDDGDGLIDEDVFNNQMGRPDTAQVSLGAETATLELPSTRVAVTESHTTTSLFSESTAAMESTSADRTTDGSQTTTLPITTTPEPQIPTTIRSTTLTPSPTTTTKTPTTSIFPTTESWTTSTTPDPITTTATTSDIDSITTMTARPATVEVTTPPQPTTLTPTTTSADPSTQDVMSTTENPPLTTANFENPPEPKTTPFITTELNPTTQSPPTTQVITSSTLPTTAPLTDMVSTFTPPTTQESSTAHTTPDDVITSTPGLTTTRRAQTTAGKFIATTTSTNPAQMSTVTKLSDATTSGTPTEEQPTTEATTLKILLSSPEPPVLPESGFDILMVVIPLAVLIGVPVLFVVYNLIKASVNTRKQGDRRQIVPLTSATNAAAPQISKHNVCKSSSYDAR